VQVIGRADVDDVDAGIRGERLGAVEDAGHVERGGGRARAVGVGAGDPDDLGAGEPRGAEMDRANEADSGDRGT